MSSICACGKNKSLKSDFCKTCNSEVILDNLKIRHICYQMSISDNFNRKNIFDIYRKARNVLSENFINESHYEKVVKKFLEYEKLFKEECNGCKRKFSYKYFTKFRGYILCPKCLTLIDSEKNAGLRIRDQKEVDMLFVNSRITEAIYEYMQGKDGFR
jgi:hypothetical protein